MPNRKGSERSTQYADAAPTRGMLASQALEALPPLKTPEKLTIRFSRASDIDTFVDLYSGPRKYQIDPKGFIRERSYKELVESVKRGAAVLALDENGHIRASALAQRHHHAETEAENFTEIGAVMCDVAGVGLPKLVVGMLSLKQHFDPRANAKVYAKVARDNDASNHVFAKSMKWNKVSDEARRESLFDVAYAEKNGEGNRTRTWYAFREAAQERAVEEIRTAIVNEALHGKNGQVIPLDVTSSSLWSMLQFHEMLTGHHDMN